LPGWNWDNGWPIRHMGPGNILTLDSSCSQLDTSCSQLASSFL
jgi:hypothetical protein